MKIIYSDKILNRLSIFMNIGGITLYPFIILRERYKIYQISGKIILNHEKIHIKQQIELLVVFFYIFYILNYIVNLLFYWNNKKAYENICFEKEANTNELNDNYLNERKLYSWLKYIFKKP